MKTTVGQLMINEQLPPELRDYNRVLDKKGVADLLQKVAEQYPEQYRDIAKKLSDVGRTVAYTVGGHSFGLKALRSSRASQTVRQELAAKLQRLYTTPGDPDEKKKELIRTVGAYQGKLIDEVLTESKQDDNPLARQLVGAGRGNKFQLNSLRGADLLYVDHKNEVLPIPVLRNYSQGLRPYEYFAGAFGTRKGVMDLKSATQDAGFFAKQLVQATHRLMVTDIDDENPYDEASPRGLPVDTDDADNEGALLAHPVGGYPRNTLLTPKILKELRNSGHERILVRSPTVGGPDDGGVYSRDVGKRERGEMTPIGDFTGVAAAQALSEPVTQAQISSKHCLAAGTLVRMADWTTKPIEQIVVGDYVLGANMTGGTFPVRVVQTYANGVRECVSTTFRVPFVRNPEYVKLVSTADHKVLMLRKVTNSQQEYLNNTPQQLPVGTNTGRLVAVRPTGYTGSGRSEPFALVAGLLLGDGCYTNAVNSCNFSCFDPLLIADVQPLLASLNLKLTKLKGHHGYYKFAMVYDDLTAYRDQETGCVVTGPRNPIRRWLVERGMWGKYAHEKQLPADVHTWDNQSIANLIAGYFVTDGSVFLPTDHRARSKPYFSFGSTSQSLLLVLRELLAWRFGIYTTTLYENVYGGRKRPMYTININTEQSIRKFYEAIPIYGIKRVKAAEYMAAWRVERTNALPRLVREQLTSVGKHYTYDIEVDHPDHLFVLANGLIVSNSGGIAGNATAGAVSGFKYLNSLVQVPKVFRGGAAHAQLDGRVQDITEAPQGGYYVTIGTEKHYVGRDYPLKVKVGDEVEAGDSISEGIPNPAEIVKHKGVGEGRAYFTQAFRQALLDSNTYGSRRNIELLARGLINHVRLTNELGDWAPDDVVPYQMLERSWQPRPGHLQAPLKTAVGKYLERPVLHYTIGTKVRPSMLANLEKFGVQQLVVHPEPPPFQPEMIRGMANAAHDPDWMTRMLGSYQQKSLLDAVHRGATADEDGTSYVPALAAGAPMKDLSWKSLSQPIPGTPPKPPSPPDKLKVASILSNDYDNLI